MGNRIGTSQATILVSCANHHAFEPVLEELRAPRAVGARGPPQGAEISIRVNTKR